MTQQRRELGRSGEDRAAAFVASLGWLVLERGWRSRLGEIDIIARDGDTLVFVEVKARSSSRFGAPEDSVGPAKRSRIVKAALAYISSAGVGDAALRFDVIAVDDDGLRHIPGAFGAEGYTY